MLLNGGTVMNHELILVSALKLNLQEQLFRDVVVREVYDWQRVQHCTISSCDCNLQAAREQTIRALSCPSYLGKGGQTRLA